MQPLFNVLIKTQRIVVIIIVYCDKNENICEFIRNLRSFRVIKVTKKDMNQIYIKMTSFDSPQTHISDLYGILKNKNLF